MVANPSHNSGRSDLKSLTNQNNECVCQIKSLNLSHNDKNESYTVYNVAYMSTVM